jgi:thiol:disulfide interchange protein DsbD
VISLKILGFVQQAGEDPRRVRRHGYAFGTGVLVSFWALAGLLLGLRAAGEALGWGFQFQEPGFTGALCLLMFAVGLNLLGVFEVGVRLSGRAGDAEARGHAGYVGSFSSGVLATVVATPCTAPFMGVALGYALAAPVVSSLLVFTALGAGMAAPYVVLSAFPGWLRRLPAPGRWMETFKQAMAFPMFAVVVGVGLVFGRQTGVDGLVRLLFALLLVGIAAWLWGRFGGVGAEGVKRAVAGRALPAVFMAGGVVALVLGCARTPEGSDAPPQGWLAWKPGIEAELRAQGRPVFVDYTADWCLTCLANDKAVLSTDTVRTAAQVHGVAMVRADWTRKSSDIRDALALLGRASIPVYVVYPPDPAAPGEVLPTTITPSTIVDAFTRASGRTP